MNTTTRIKRFVKMAMGQPVAIVETKQDSETRFWHEQIDDYIKWYNGEIQSIYETPAPKPAEKIKAPNLKDSAILTLHRLHQEVKYLYDLKLSKDAFKGKRIMDIGAGPMPSATCFEGADLYCLEPLIDRYLKIGFPIHYYGNVKFVHSPSEQIPIEDNFFDAIISVNALDHVDDFEKTAKEIGRVLKPGGSVVFHLHYHLPTQNEPLELNDKRVTDAFSMIGNLRKVSESKEKMGYQCSDDELYTLWTNM
jgi:SAM-dependent methyltransferase